jgi:hypothetical protein
MMRTVSFAWMLSLVWQAPLVAEEGKPAAPAGAAPAAPSAPAASPVVWPAGCPDLEKIGNICLNLTNFTKDPAPRGDYSYMYQRKIYDAACVDLQKDSEALMKRKIQEMWRIDERQPRPRMTCNNLQFDVASGNILKFAVRKRFQEFLEDAVWWGVHLNRVDASDQRTVLDYVKDELDRTSHPSTRSTLQAYYQILREGGAKHRSEL